MINIKGKKAIAFVSFEYGKESYADDLKKRLEKKGLKVLKTLNFMSQVLSETQRALFDKRKPEIEATDTISVLQTVKQKPFIFAVYGLGLWIMVLLYTNVTFIPQLLSRAFNINNSLVISSFLGAMGVAAAISAFMYKGIKTKFSYNVIAFVGLGLWAFGLILLSQAISILTVLVMMVLFGVGQGMVMPTLNLWVGELTKTCARGRMISYLTTFLFIGQFLPPIIFNPIFSALSFNGVFLIAGIICAILTMLFFSSWKLSRKRG
jgi:sugar phosphate permease